MTDWTNIEPVEALKLRCKTHKALILLAPADGGWTWAADCSRLYGDVAGWAEPLGRWGGGIRPDRFAATREAALEAARAVIRSRITDQPNIDWLDSLTPDQPDLFAERKAAHG